MRQRLREIGDGEIVRRLRLPVAAAAIVVAGMLLGWRLAGPIVEETALGRVSFEIVPSLDGRAVGYVPIADWGFRADAYTGPFSIEAELRALDREAVLRAAGGDDAVLTEAEENLRSGARQAVLRALVWGLGVSVVLAAVVALLWSRTRRGRLLLPGSVAGLALVAGAASAFLAERTFDAQAFEQPTYFARGAELSQLLAVAERERERNTYASSFEGALRGFSAFLTRSAPRGAPGPEIVVASDLHNNALVIGPLRRFVRGQPVLLVGDFGHDGSEREAELLAPRLAELSGRVLAVSGNHDSSQLMRSLADAGVTVLGAPGGSPGDKGDGGTQVADVRGLAIAGFPDPLEWRGEVPSDPARIFSFSELEDGDQRLRTAIEELIGWFYDLDRRPDIVMVHQNALAQGLAERLREDGYRDPLTIVTGHDHRQHVDRFGPIAVVDGGTVGAGGIFGIGQDFASLAELHFDRDDPTLRSVDLISVEPLSGQAQAERVVLDSVCPPEEANREPCRYEPGTPEL